MRLFFIILISITVGEVMRLFSIILISITVEVRL